MPKKRYSADVKAKAVLEVLKERKTANEIAKQFSVHPTQLSIWKKQLVEGLPAFFGDPEARRSETQDSALVGQLYEEIGRLKVELDFLKKKTSGLR